MTDPATWWRPWPNGELRLLAVVPPVVVKRCADRERHGSLDVPGVLRRVRGGDIVIVGAQAWRLDTPEPGRRRWRVVAVDSLRPTGQGEPIPWPPRQHREHT